MANEQMDQPYTTAAQQLVNYDWADLAGGVGYITYYAGISTDTGGKSYFLTRRIVDSYPVIENQAGAATLDLDFDITFLSPSTIKGEASFNFTQYGGAASTAATTITVYHVNAAAAETSIGATTAATRAGTDATPFRELVLADLTEKHFAIGDKLRINVSLVHAGGNVAGIWFDPASSLTRTDDLTRTVGTDFVAQIPFKVDRQ